MEEFNNNIIKCGPKSRHLQIPDEYYLLENSVIVQEKDLVAHLYDLLWIPIEEDEIGLPAEDVGDYVIRKKI